MFPGSGILESLGNLSDMQMTAHHLRISKSETEIGSPASCVLTSPTYSEDILVQVTVE